MKIRMDIPKSAGIVRWGKDSVPSGETYDVLDEAFPTEREVSGYRIMPPSLNRVIVAPTAWCTVVEP